MLEQVVNERKRVLFVAQTAHKARKARSVAMRAENNSKAKPE